MGGFEETEEERGSNDTDDEQHQAEPGPRTEAEQEEKAEILEEAKDAADRARKH